MDSGPKPGVFGHTRSSTRVPDLELLVILGYQTWCLVILGYQTWCFWSHSGYQTWCFRSYSGAKPGVFGHTRIANLAFSVILRYAYIPGHPPRAHMPSKTHLYSRQSSITKINPPQRRTRGTQSRPRGQATPDATRYE